MHVTRQATAAASMALPPASIAWAAARAAGSRAAAIAARRPAMEVTPAASPDAERAPIEDSTKTRLVILASAHGSLDYCRGSETAFRRALKLYHNTARLA